ncbi:MAG: EamA family transporter [Tissierellia bacterium]|nr:EamA family transporter [Tissierellia bacterium]
MTNSKFKDYLALHGVIFLSSFSIIVSKLASDVPFLSGKFIFYFYLLNFLSVIFAIVWQQVIKRIPLNTAFSTRSLGIIWGVLWGIIFFEEKLTPMMIAGSLIIILGIVLVVYADE